VTTQKPAVPYLAQALRARISKKDLQLLWKKGLRNLLSVDWLCSISLV